MDLDSDLQKVNAINDCLQDCDDIHDYDTIAKRLKPKLKHNIELNLKLNTFLEKHIQDYKQRQEAKDELFGLVSEEIVSILKGIQSQRPICNIM